MTYEEITVRQMARLKCTCTDDQKARKTCNVCGPCGAKNVLKDIDEYSKGKYELFLSEGC